MVTNLIYIPEPEYEAVRRRASVSRWVYWISGMVAGFILAVVLGYAGESAAQGSITVVDGDTIKVNGQSWRLMGYATPETNFAKCDAEYQAGVLATKELEVLIRKAKTIDPVADGGLDKYRRQLGRLLIDGRDVADIMVERGLARRYDGRGKRQGWCGEGRDQ